MTNNLHADATTFRALLLEDDDFDLMSFRRLLTRSRTAIDLEHHSSIQDAEFSLSSDSVDIVIADMNLMDSRGLETFTRCKERWPDKPIIILSGMGSEQVAEECVRQGAQDYLVKGSIDAKSLLRSVRYAMERHRASKDREALIASLEDARKLEAVGLLASGVAHEINTPTQYVMDNCSFLKAATSQMLQALASIRGLVSAEGSPLEREICQLVADLDPEYLESELPFALNESIGGLGHIQRIVQAMKEFSYPEPEHAVATDLNRAIEMAIVIASGEWKHVAAIEKDFEDDLPWVECHPGTIKQVILNLVVNAAHAIGELAERETATRGTITVRTRLVSSDVVEIQVIDTGCGIPKEELERVKLPFFTTKPLGKGTGQGLALTERMVTHDHQGSLEIQSELGQGTTVVIRLPVKANDDGGHAEAA